MSFLKSGNASFEGRRREHNFQLESELLRLIDSSAVAPLRKLIVRQNGCENDAKTIKTLACFLFFSVINSNCSKPGPSPNEYAKLTDAILQTIPPTLRDWSCATAPNAPPNAGKELFRHLIQKCAQSYLQDSSNTEGTSIIPGERAMYNAYGSNADKATTIRSLKDEGKFLLVEFIAELVGVHLLPPRVVYDYSLKLIRSTSAPTPTPSDLEAVCRLLSIADKFTQSQSWSIPLFNALDHIRHRDREQLDKRLNVVLLVCSCTDLTLTDLEDALDW
jgi:hypothetical protein